jgi:FdhD protein
MQHPTSKVHITKLQGRTRIEQHDLVAIEEPLEIRIAEQGQAPKSISVTMRTPGHDAMLALGFLYTEGILESPKQVLNCHQIAENIVQIDLHPGIELKMQGLERNFYTTSSCGVCGKTALDAIRTVHKNLKVASSVQVASEVIHALPNVLLQHQQVFAQTGGLHACTLFNLQGQLLNLREDVGRHNALDKLIGDAFLQNWIDWSQSILLLSGRASFELVQKSASTGVQIVAAIGAPSSLAVQLAEEFGITLIGFLRADRMNIYTRAERVIP